MASHPLKPRRPRRLVFPPLTDQQQALFTFDADFPKDQRKPEAETVLAARRRGKKTSVVVPEGMHVQIRDRADLAWHPIEPQRGRGRPPKPSSRTWESGTWEDDDLPPEVSAIVGKDRRDRKASGPAIVKDLRSMAGRWLGRTLTAKEHDRLRALTLGQQNIRRALGRATASRTQPVKASAIVRELLSWRHNLTDPNVRRMQRSRRAGRPPVKMIFR